MMKRIWLGLMVVCSLIACEQKQVSKEIVFVCTHGAARSPIAAAYFNEMAKENNLNYHAIFRGTEPDTALTLETAKGLSHDGFGVNSWKPKKVSKQDIKKAYKIITFDCSVPIKNISVLKEEWNGTPSISKDYNAARDAIKENVELLIDRLRKEKD